MGSTPLTEGMILARTKCSDLDRVTKLNCWGIGLTDIKIIQRLNNVEVLSLSVNSITTIRDVQYCKSLKELYLRDNRIQEISEILYLRDLPNLTHLWLADNPCANFDRYRPTVLKYLPQLHKLDDRTVCQEEVQEAPQLGHALIDENTQENGYHDNSPASDSRRSSYCEPQRPPSVQSERYGDPQYDQYLQSQETNRSSPERDTDSRFFQGSQTPQSPENISSREAYEGSQTSTPSRHGYYEDYNNVSQQNYRGVQSNTEQSYNSSDSINRNLPSTPGVNSNDRMLPRTYPTSRPRNRNSNILSAVLCLVKELDFPSLEVVEMAVRSRMDELEG